MSDSTPASAESEAIRRRFLAVDTSNVADVLDKLGLPDQGLSAEFQPFPASAPRMAGWAYTIRGQMTPFPLGGDPDKMKACKGIGPGEVSVWSGDGEGICYFGELIALGMKERGSVGALVDGGIRDVRWIGGHGFPVYARYRTPVQSIGRWKVNAWQVPVLVRGATVKWVRIEPGDLILADEDGAIAVPRKVVDAVLVEAERLTAIEVDIRKELAAGLSLDQALEKFGHV
ncbi:MAG TPA: RraA family protein [Bauldia sp.]|nr:RraA family protein [Bauldia sp.]